MTIPEAAELVIQVGATAEGGDVFVLDMGDSVKIFDLARRMIELSGLSLRDETNPDGDIAIEVTGLRPGEKLSEELLIGYDPKPTAHPHIMRAQEAFTAWGDFEKEIQKLEKAVQENSLKTIRSILQALIVGCKPNDSISNEND